jgi:hypothetical protein
MKRLLSILLLAAALAASPAAGQTIKSLGFNTTNGQVVANTGTNVLTFTNSVYIGGSVRILDGTNKAFEFPNDAEAEFSYAISFLNTNAAATTRTNLGGTTVGDSVFTATNAAAAATAIGLGTANTASFDSLIIGAGSGDPLNVDFYRIESSSFNFLFDWEEKRLAQGGNDIFSWNSTNATFPVPVSFSTNVTVNGNISVGSLTTTTPSTWALDATQTAAATNGILDLPSNANVIRLTNNNAISGVSGGVLGAFYYLVNQATNAVTISNVGGITVQGGTPLTLGANQAATLVATGATNASVAARGDLNDVTLGGTLNIAPAQTADSADSLMTRGLSDARYPIYETIHPNNNQTAADTENFYGPVITIPLNWVPSSIQIYAELEFTSSPVAAGPTNFRFRTAIRDVEGGSMNSSLNTSIVNATSVTNVSGDRYIIKGEITTFPASWSTRLASHETIFLVLDATVFNETGGSLTLVNNQAHRVGYRIFR